MNGSFRLAAAVTLAVVSFVGCADNRVRELEELSQRHTTDIETLRSIQAENTAAIADVRAELGRLTGKMEEVQYVAKGKTEELERTLERVSSRVPPPAGVPEDLLNDDEALIGRITGEQAERYRNGLRQLRGGDFEGARVTFTAFVEENPKTAFTDNGFFWLGVIHEQLGQLDRAIGYYSEAFQRFPAEDRVAPALYRLAEAFLKMNSKKDATLTLQKLVDEHPNTDYGRRGRALLQELRGAPRPAAKKQSPKKSR